MSAILTVGSMWRRCQGSYVQYGSATATVLPLLPPAGHLCACASSTCLTVPCATAWRVRASQATTPCPCRSRRSRQTISGGLLETVSLHVPTVNLTMASFAQTGWVLLAIGRLSPLPKLVWPYTRYKRTGQWRSKCRSSSIDMVFVGID